MQAAVHEGNLQDVGLGIIWIKSNIFDFQEEICYFIKNSHRLGQSERQRRCKNKKKILAIRGKVLKLDGVGPIDNRPSTDKLHHIVRRRRKN